MPEVQNMNSNQIPRIVRNYSNWLHMLAKLYNFGGDQRLRYRNVQVAVENIFSNILDVILEGGDSQFLDCVLSSLERRSRLHALRRLLCSFSNGLSEMLQLDTIPFYVTSAFDEMHHCLVSELFQMFVELRQFVTVPKEDIARYKRMTSYLQVFSDVFHNALRDNNFSSHPVVRLRALQDYMDYLSEIVHRSHMMSNPAFRGVYDEIIEGNTVFYRYKKLRKFTNNEDSGETCPICLGFLEEDEDARRLPCFHLFHKECADRWLRKDRRCPVCRIHIQGREEF